MVFYPSLDVIGVVQDMGYCQLNEGAGKKLQVNFTMKDLRSKAYHIILSFTFCIFLMLHISFLY